jgi:GTP-binding protein HflX
VTPSAHAANGGRPRGRARQRAYLIATTAESGPQDLLELQELLRTAGVAAVGQIVQHRQQPHPNTYLGAGKLEELKADLGRADANLVACDDELSPRQERNLESALGMPVIDRTAIILDIFAAHAHTAEGKLQVELAQLEYNLARMRGLWSHLERLGAGRIDGGIGTRGPGETQIETDRRLARDRISALRRKLADVRASRSVMRAERDRARLPQVALAGYTNAGKSTLLNALTGSTVGVGERLFHTLDPTTRVLRIKGRSYLLTDTVGFIRKLPHQLVDAFGATLEETRLADLVLHVVDASAPEEELLAMISAVEDVLHEIEADQVTQVLVLSKADSVSEDRRRELALRHPDAVLVSARTGEGLETLTDRIEHEFERTLQEVDLLIPYDQGAQVALLHDLDGDLEREETAAGIRIRARLHPAAAARYGRFATNGRLVTR